MKTREERTGRTPGRSYNGPPLAAGSTAGDGPSPFLSRPSSPLSSKQRAHTGGSLPEDVQQMSLQPSAAVEGKQELSHHADQADEPVAHTEAGPNSVRRRHRTASMDMKQSPGSTYPPSRSVSGIRPLSGPSPSFMMGSWAGYSSKAGIVGMGSHSLMQWVQLTNNIRKCAVLWLTIRVFVFFVPRHHSPSPLSYTTLLSSITCISLNAASHTMTRTTWLDGLNTMQYTMSFYSQNDQCHRAGRCA